MKSITKYFLLLLIFSNQVNAWTIEANFEDGAAGQKAMLPNQDAFHGNADNSKYTSAQKHSGSQSGSVTTVAGDKSGGFGKWGGSWNFPSKLRQGDEIWFRVWVYYPPGFNFTADSPSGMKFMRIHVATEAGATVGYHNNYIKSPGLLNIDGGVSDSAGNTVYDTYPLWTDPTLRGAAGEDVGSNIPGVAQITLGTWHAYEQYVKFDPTPGKGVWRTWFDGELVFEDTLTGTMKSTSDVSDFIYIWTYWNGGAPTNQTAYIDDVIITSDQPNNFDINGNPFIGTGNVSFIARPKAPSVISVD